MWGVAGRGDNTHVVIKQDVKQDPVAEEYQEHSDARVALPPVREAHPI